MNRAARYGEPRRDECDERLVRGAVNRRSREAHDDRVVSDACYCCFSCARDDAHIQFNAIAR
jgi:hypothetical protein